MSKTILRRVDPDVEIPTGCLGTTVGMTISAAVAGTLGAGSFKSKMLMCFVMSATGTGMVSAVCGSGVPDLLLGVEDAGERWESGR